MPPVDECWQVQRSSVHLDAMSHFQPFPNTHWSLVKRAGLADHAARREALAALLERYLPPLRSYLRHTWHLREEDAEELLQAFIAERILEHELISQADQTKGRFRSLLLTSLRNFVVSNYRYQKIRKTDALGSIPIEDRNPTSDQAVQAEWARTLINGAVETMRKDCEHAERQDVWTVFEQRVLATIFNNEQLMEYGELAHRLGLSSPTQAANLLVTAKRMFKRLLRSAVGEYERDGPAIDEEINDLWRILAESPTSQEQDGFQTRRSKS